jgi:hypothetical protein
VQLTFSLSGLNLILVINVAFIGVLEDHHPREPHFEVVETARVAALHGLSHLCSIFSISFKPRTGGQLGGPRRHRIEWLDGGILLQDKHVLYLNIFFDLLSTLTLSACYSEIN